jgi:hypothetical protein
MLARISSALFDQMKGVGASLCCATLAVMASRRALVLW